MMDVFNLQASIGIDTKDFLNGIKNAISAGQKLKQNVENQAQAIMKQQVAMDTLKNKLEVTQNATKTAAEKVEYLRDNFNDYAKITGTASEETQILYEALEKAERELASCEKAEAAAAQELENYSSGLEDAGNGASGTAGANSELADETRNAGDEAKTAGDRFSEFSDTMKNVASTVGDVVVGIAKVSTAIAGALTAATTGAVAATVKEVSALAAYGDQVDKQSQKIGISAQAYQEWDAIMQHSGSSVGSMIASMRTLVSAAQSDSDALKSLGITQKEALGMDQEELFSKVITRLQNMEDKTQRTYLATKLLGRGAMEFGALLNTSAEDTEKMRQRVHELGGVLTDTAVKDAARFQDSLQDMQTGFEGVKRRLLTDFLPSFATVMDGITDIFAGDTIKGQVEISDGLAKVSNNIDDVLPKVLALADYFGEMAEKVLPVVGNVFDKVSDHIIGAMSNIEIGDLIEKALGLVNAGADKVEKVGDALFGLIEGAISELPGKLPAIAGTINTLVTKLIDGISTVISSDGVDDLLDAVIKAVLSIAENLANNIEPLANAVLTLASNLVTVILDNLDDIINSASTIIQTLLDAILKDDGILDGAAKIVSALADGIINNSDDIFIAIQELLSALWDKELDPETSEKLVEFGSKIIVKLAEAILAAAGSSIGFLSEMYEIWREKMLGNDWSSVGTAIIDGLTKGLFSDDGTVSPVDDFAQAWADGFIDIENSVSSFITTIGDYWQTGWNTLEEFGGKIYDGIENFKTKWTEFWTGVADTFVEKVELFKEKVQAIPDKIKELVDKAKKWGSDLIDNFVSGLNENPIIKGASKLAQTIKDHIGFSEPKEGPLSNFHTYAPDMIDLFASGIEDNAYKIEDAFDKSLDFGTVSTSGSAQSGSASNGAVNGTFTAELLNVLHEILYAIKEGKTISVSAIDSALGQLQSIDERTDFA